MATFDYNAHRNRLRAIYGHQPDPKPPRQKRSSIWMENLSRSDREAIERLPDGVFDRAYDERLYCTKSKTITASKAQDKADGLYRGGMAPFGWRAGEPDAEGLRYLVEHPEEQAAILWMAAMRKRNRRGEYKKTLREISAALSKRGIKLSHEGVAATVRAHEARVAESRKEEEAAEAAEREVRLEARRARERDDRYVKTHAMKRLQGEE